MYSEYTLNNQGDSIQPWHTPYPIWNQSVVLCPVLTVASWPAYRFLKRQVRWSGIPISFRIFHSLLFTIVKTWKQIKYPWTEEWIKKRYGTCINNGILFSHKKEWASWIELEIIILSEVNQKEKGKYYVTFCLYIEYFKKYKWTYLQNRNRLIDLESEFKVTRGERLEEGYITSLGLTYTQCCCCCLVAKSRLTLLQPHELKPARLLYPWNFPGKNSGVDCHFLLQWIFPTQGSNPRLLHKRHLLHCKHILTAEILGKPDIYTLLYIYK